MSATQTEPRARWLVRAADHSLPLWLRVVSYAEAHAGRNGHCPLTAGELHRRIDDTVTKGAISRAIATAVRNHWLHPASTARCLVLEPAPVDIGCPANHHTQPVRSTYARRKA